MSVRDQRGERVTVANVATIIRGVSYPGNEARKAPGPDLIPLLRATNITNDLTFDDLVYVPESRVKPDQLLRGGDIVVAASSGSRDVVGKAAQLKDSWRGTFGAFCYVVRPSRDINPRYLGLFFQTQAYRQRATSLASGVNINNLRRNHILTMQLPLPSPSRQEEIVATVEQHLVSIEDGLRTVGSASRRLEACRRVILTHWLAPPDPLPPDWSRATLPELAKPPDGIFSDGDWVETKDQDPNGEVRLIQLADIGEGRFLDRSARSLTLPKARELGCTFLRKGDVLVARMASPLARACVFPGSDRPCVAAVDICIVRPTSGVHGPWLCAAIDHPAFRRKAEELQRGTTRARISRKNLGLISLLLPPLVDQRRLADEIQARLSELDSVDSLLRSARQRGLRLRASVLAAHFGPVPTSARDMEEVAHVD